MATTTTTSTLRSSISVKFNLTAVSKAIEPAKPPVHEFKRGDPWLDDGSIILQTQSTIFKVHRSVLARNAEIFADTFQMPQPDKPADDQALIDGCSVLPLTDDPTELSHFLRALYDGHKYAYLRSDTSTLCVLTLKQVLRG